MIPRTEPLCILRLLNAADEPGAELDSSSLTELESSLCNLSLLIPYAACECQRRDWLCSLTSLKLLQVILAFTAHTSELEHKYLTELKASLKASITSQVFMMYLSELENVPVKLGHVASNIRAYSCSEIGSNILPPQKCILASSQREGLLTFL